MKQAFFLSDHCQEIADILYENCAELEESYCSAMLERLTPFKYKMDDELDETAIKTLDKLLENVRKRIPSNTTSTETRDLRQLNSLSNSVFQELSRESSRLPVIESMVMTLLSNTTVYGNVDATLIAKLLGNLCISGSNHKIKVAEVKGCLALPDGASINFTEEQLGYIATRLESIKNLPVPLAELQQELIENYRNEHWYLKRLFDGTKVLVEDSYISLSIITSEQSQRKQQQLANVDFAKNSNVTNERVPSHEDLFVHKEPIALSDLFKRQSDEPEDPKRLIVFGRAGIGKSVLCQYLTTRWYQEVAGDFKRPIIEDQLQEIKFNAEKEEISWLKKFKVVFWIRLREIPDLLKDVQNDGSLENIINVCCYNGREEQKKLKKSLEQYKQESLFILDGYDEIEDSFNTAIFDRASTLGSTWNILKAQPNIIITSRPTSKLDSLGSPGAPLRKLEVMGFSNKQIKSYVKNFMLEPSHKEKRSAAAFLGYLKSKPSIWGVAHIPINLEMLCWLYKEGDFNLNAATLSELYTEIVYQVTREMSEPKNRDSKKTVKYPDLSKPFTKGYARKTKAISIQFLEALAYQAMKKNELLIKTQTIKWVAKQVLRKEKLLEGNDEGTLTEKLLESGHHLGFLRGTQEGGQELQKKSHYFIHLSFQEYFAARYVVSRLTETEETKEKCDIIRQLETDKHNSRYQLMWWLTAGLLTYQEELSNYNALETFAHTVFLSFLSQDYMSEMDFNLVVHCLDECLGINAGIMYELFSPLQYKNLQKKMRTYFCYFVFYEDSKLREKTLETLERCSHFFSMRPFIDELFFERLIDFSKKRSIDESERLEACEILLKIPEYSNQTVENLIGLTGDKNLNNFGGERAWWTVSKMSDHIKQVAERLLIFAQDKSTDASQRMQAWKVLLKIPEHTKKAAKGLIALAQERSTVAYQRREIWQTLLKIPEYSKQAAKGFIALGKDESVGGFQRSEAWTFLLQIPAYAKKAAEALIKFAKTKGVDDFSRWRAWDALLSMPGLGHAKDAETELILLAEDKNVNASERRLAWKTLLEILGCTEKIAKGLIALAEDKSITDDERMEVWEILLTMPEHATRGIAKTIITFLKDKETNIFEISRVWESLLKNAQHIKQEAKILIALTEDETISDDVRIKVWEILLKMPEHAVWVAKALIVFGEDKNVDFYLRRKTWQILLKIPEHSIKSIEGLIVLLQEKSWDAFSRGGVWRILLQEPQNIKQVATTFNSLTRGKSVSSGLKREMCQMLLKIPESVDEAETALVTLARDKSIDIHDRKLTLEVLLKIPKRAEQAAIELIALAEDKSIDADKRIPVWQILLKIPEHGKRAAVALIKLAKYRDVYDRDREEIWTTLLKTPSYEKQAAIELIALAEDKKVDSFVRILVCRILLKISEYSEQAIRALSALAADKSVYARDRTESYKILLGIPDHIKEATEGLISLAKDESIGTRERIAAWEVLLESEHAKEAAETLISFLENEIVETWQKKQVWESLLAIPEYAEKAREALDLLKHAKRAAIKLAKKDGQCQARACNEQTDTDSSAFVAPLVYLQTIHANSGGQTLTASAEEKQPRVFRGRPRPVPRTNTGDDL